MQPPELLTGPAVVRHPAPPPAIDHPTRVEVEDRRRPSRARLTFKPQPRQIRSLLEEVEFSLSDCDFRQRRQIRLLVGEVVARLLTAAPKTPIELGIEVKENSVRLDVWTETGGGPCEFFDQLEEAVFLDLASTWGRDRRRECGAWFEVL